MNKDHNNSDQNGQIMLKFDTQNHNDTSNTKISKSDVLGINKKCETRVHIDIYNIKS